MIIFGLLLVIACAAACPTGQDCDHTSVPRRESESDVIEELRNRNVKEGLPRSDAPVVVLLGLYVQALTKVDVEAGYMEVVGYMSMRWEDPRLRFKYSLPFHDIAAVRLRPEYVWMPDIELYSPYPPGIQMLNMGRHMLVADYNGTVLHYPIVAVRSLCDFKEQLGVNGTQVQCSLKFGSWTYPMILVDVMTNQKDPILGEYKPNGQWTVTNVSSVRNEIKYDCCPKAYADITFTFTLQRK